MSGRESPVPAPAAVIITCAHCAGPVDPLRAVRVRFVADRFCYFCTVNCEQSFAAESFESSAELGSWAAERAADNDLSVDATDLPTDAEPSSPTPRAVVDPRRERASRRDSSSRLSTPPAAPLTPPSRLDELPRQTLALALGTSVLSVVLLLAADNRVILLLRLGLDALATLGLIFYATKGSADARSNSRTLALLCFGALVLALGVAFVGNLDAATYVSFSGALCGFAAVTLLLIERYAVPIKERRAELVDRLQSGVLRVRGERTESVVHASLRPGEEIVIHAGEVVAADVTIVAGRGEIQPWFSATSVRLVRPGDFVYAGARLQSGQLRATVRWTGHDVFFLRLTEDPNRAAAQHSPMVQLASKLAFRGALGAVLVTSIAGLAEGLPYHVLVLNALASLCVMANPATVKLVALRTTEAVLDALKNGIVIRSASVLDAAGRVSSAVFCARGTLLLGEPELSTVEPLGTLSDAEVLALVAGAEQGAEHPVAVAIHRAARARGISPDAVRNLRAESGLGATALASSGKPLVVGSRPLMLRERISVARAEARITELEATGRTVLLVAIGQHLVGLLAFQDGMRAGARAAVQHLLDVGIEPILLSGDRRESCEALGRAVDIDHIRPEVLPTERGHEVERLRASGAVVAVVGRSPVDDIALSAATVSVTLPNSGAPAGAFDIELAGDEIQKAAVALRLLHRCRSESLACIAWLTGSGAVVSLAVLLMSAPPALIPGLGAVAVWIAVALLTNGQRPRN